MNRFQSLVGTIFISKPSASEKLSIVWFCLDFVDPSNNYCNVLWMDLCSVDLFGNQKSNWDVSLKIMGIDTKNVFPMAYIDQDSSATQVFGLLNTSASVKLNSLRPGLVLLE